MRAYPGLVAAFEMDCRNLNFIAGWNVLQLQNKRPTQRPVGCAVLGSVGTRSDYVQLGCLKFAKQVRSVDDPEEIRLAIPVEAAFADDETPAAAHRLRSRIRVYPEGVAAFDFLDGENIEMTDLPDCLGHLGRLRV